MNINELKKAIEENNLSYIVRCTTQENWSVLSSNPAKNHQVIALYHAIKFNRLVILIHFLMKNWSLLHTKNQDGQTALMIAAEEGNFGLVQLLVTIGANVQDFTNEHDKLYPIHFAIRGQFSQIAIYLFAANVPFHLSLSPLIVFAARFRDLNTVKYLYKDNPFSLNDVDRKNQSALLWASANGDMELVKYLLEKKPKTEFATISGHNYPNLHLVACDLNDIKKYMDCNTHGRTALHWAVYNNHLEVVKVLLEYGANTEVRSGSFNLHIIHLAVYIRSLEMVLLLLKHNPAWINTECSPEVTPAILAAILGFEEIVGHLLQVRGYVRDKTLVKPKPLTQKACFAMAAKYGHANLLNVLLEFSYRLPQNCIEDRGLNLLHITAGNGNLAAVDLVFKKYPIFLNKGDSYNQTPLFWAVKNACFEVVQYLIQQGADISQVYKNPSDKEFHGKNALDVALKNQYYAVANALILKTYSPFDIDTLLSLVQSAEQALDLANQAPELSQHILQDSRIRGLILSFPALKESEYSRAIYQTSRPRSESTYTKIDLTTNTFTCFKPQQSLGSGSYGNVRLFTNAAKEHIAVKSLIKDWERPITTTLASLTPSLDKEARIFGQVYRAQNPVSTFHKIRKKNNTTLFYTNRFVMPYMKGETLLHLLPTVMDVNLLAQIILEFAKELNRIHHIEPGIIHGDIGPKNILIYINNHQIHIMFIDYGRAYYLTDKSPWCIDEKYRFNTWYPPELCCRKEATCKPNFNQDVYQLGYTLDYVLQKNKSYDALTHYFPSIGDFIDKAQEAEPFYRPVLNVFIDALQGEIDKKITQTIPISNNRNTLWSNTKEVDIESQNRTLHTTTN